MSWIETSLTRLEKSLRAMFEGNPSWDGIPRKLRNQLFRALTQALRSWADERQGESGDENRPFSAPDKYILLLQSEHAQVLLAHSADLDRLAHQLESMAVQFGLLVTTPPMLQVVPDPKAIAISVFCEQSQARMSDSHTTELDQRSAEADTSSEGVLPKAFLIVNGLSTFLLTQPVVNIGSDPSSQLVLNDPGVARMHAQVRFIFGRFVIFDLDSMGGTLVNGSAISNHVLSPGDVILLAGVPLVYGQDTATQLGYTQELPAEPLSPEVL